MKNIFITLLFFLLLSFTTKAQLSNNADGIISGRVLDSLTLKPIEYATMSVINKDGTVVNGATTNDKGAFTITNVGEGEYELLVFFMGYDVKKKQGIVITKINGSYNTGSILLGGKQTTLQAVTVTGSKSIIENKIDKLVYNADQDITSQSGVASDVLKKVPQVSVDADGNVELQGSASIRFLINGKPSVIFGNNISDVLQSIPASQIKSIEIITSPGAKYDAQGTGGIINIILKKSNAEGINGSLSLSAGSRLENGSINLNGHHKHFGMNAFLSGNAQLPSRALNRVNRVTADELTGETTTLLQNGNSQYSRNGSQAGVGFDWNVTAKDNLTGTLGYDLFGNKNEGSNERSTLPGDAGNGAATDDVVETRNTSKANTWEGALTYKRTFKKEDQELNVYYEGSFENNYATYDQAQKYRAPDSIYSASYGKNPGTENQTVIGIDYAQPVADGVLIETGVKTELNRITSTSDIFLKDIMTGTYGYSTDQSNSFKYYSNVYAGYASMNVKLFKWLNVKAGLRVEYTKPAAWFSNAGDVRLHDYTTYVPSGVLSHAFKKGKLLKLSYTHRIERPEYRDVNPFVNASDPKNLTTGNSNLRPEVGDKIELGLSKTFDKGATITATLFYRGNRDDIQYYTRFYDSYRVGDTTYEGVTLTTRENIGREDNYGLMLFAVVPATSKISLRTNISMFQRYIYNGTLPGKNVQGFNYRVNMNITYIVTPEMSVELFGNFNSPRTNAQGTMPAFTTYNFAFRKQLFHKKGSIALTATNFLSTYVKQETKLNGENFTSHNVRELPYRSFGINFSYKFGRLEFKKEKEVEDINLTNPPVQDK